MADSDATNDRAQADVFAFMADPRTHGGEKVVRVDTHAASVFLAGRRAYKIKRAVRFPFLDFSTLDKRKAALQAELEINRRTAPQLYLRVLAITRTPAGGLAIGGDGDVAEWALEMARFDEAQTLDHVAARGELSLAVAERLGEAVATAHAASPEADAAAWIAALSAYLTQNAEAFAASPDLFAPEEAARLTAASRSAFARAEPLLRARGAQGFIRRGHGDLHLGNIVLIGGEPTLFDALEFDPVMASGDVLYDLGFLLMDLFHRARREAANRVLNSYLAARRRPEDLDGLGLLPLFLSLRAAIRAKVTAARLDRAQSAERAEIAAEARAYFALAGRLIRPAPPRFIAVGGLSGTGKSTLARALAPHLPPAPGAVVLRSDVERKALLGLAETAPAPPEAYAPQVTARVYATLADKARRILGAGHSAIVDAVFAREGERRMFAGLAREAGAPFDGVFLTAGLATRVARIEGRVADASDARREVAEAQESYDLGALEWAEVDASGKPDETLARTLARLGLRDIP